MADITVDLNTEGFVVPSTETTSQFKAGFPSEEGLLLALGNTLEREAGYMEVQGVNEWYSKLTGFYPVGYPTDGDSSTVGNWPAGPTGQWADEWWCVHNYLQYGGVCCVGATGTVSHVQDAYETLKDPSIDIDCVFGSQISTNVNNKLMGIVGVPNVGSNLNSRDDCIAICCAGVSGPINNNTDNIDAFPLEAIGNKNTFFVVGEKLHLKTSNTFEEDDSALETTLISPDVAGCFARTEASSKAWFSPAGFSRGRILGVVRMKYTLSESDANFLYSNNINPIRTFPGEGTFLFGDKTRRQSTEHVNFTYVNVTRLFLYLQDLIGNSARKFLFEINNNSSRSAFTNAVTPILRSIQGSGGITSYNIVCDSTNNPASIVDSNQFVADVYIKPAKSIQTIVLRFTNKTDNQVISGGSSATDGAVATATSSINTTTTSTSSGSSSTSSGY